MNKLEALISVAVLQRMVAPDVPARDVLNLAVAYQTLVATAREREAMESGCECLREAAERKASLDEPDWDDEFPNPRWP